MKKAVHDNILHVPQNCQNWFFHKVSQVSSYKSTKKVAFLQKRITSLKNAFFTKLMLHEFFNELEKNTHFYVQDGIGDN